MDTDLVTRAQGGDQEAFADLVYAVANRFLAVSHRILGDIGAATPDEVRAMKVAATIVGGIPVYCPDAAICDQFD